MTTKSESRLGITSLVLGLFALVGSLSVIVAGIAMGMSEPDPNDPKIIALGLAYMVSCGIAVLAGILAIASLIYTQRRRRTALAGLTTSALSLLAFAALALVAALAG